ncbi:hypothetical protein TNIN_147581 [Trichonephila inaurata madagascariensis]|uniref:Uncharacterized protein n=1 Tax=Trichonephila inaurata madagascariensis TaxID=2747483 RepID=A0A8X7CSJ2_9ARAC|nr:hypothetical protein TNIN_147581 [Trichonephila inaurata madagascariensis]
MAKYRNICDNNSISLTNLPFSSSSTPLLPDTPVAERETVLHKGETSSLSTTDLPSERSSMSLLPNSLVGVSEAVVFDDGSSSLAEDIARTSNSTALLPNTPIDVSEREDRESRNTSFNNKRIYSFSVKKMESKLEVNNKVYILPIMPKCMTK